MEWAEQGKGEEKGQAGDGVGWGWGSRTSKGLLGAGDGGREAGDEDAEEGAGMGAGFQETSAGAFGAGGRGCSSWARVLP